MFHSSRPDPQRKSFWQFQGVSERADGALVANFRHAIREFGETVLSEAIAYPNHRSFTLAELEDIQNAPLHPKAPKSPDPKKVSEEHEKNRMMINLAKASLTADEFNAAVEALKKPAPVQKREAAPAQEPVLAAA